MERLLAVWRRRAVWFGRVRRKRGSDRRVRRAVVALDELFRRHPPPEDATAAVRADRDAH